jgi:mannose-6-phosphate isomerase-like protein (cupin superfamily)
VEPIPPGKSYFGVASRNSSIWQNLDGVIHRHARYNDFIRFISITAKEAAMTGYFGPIEKQTEKNKFFRQVLYTGKYCQLVVMCLQPGEEIGNEVHQTVDQFFRIEEGKARFVLNGNEEHLVKEGEAAIVPAGTYHNVINASKTKKLQLYTVYAPPNHPDGTVHKDKAEAEEAERQHHH